MPNAQLPIVTRLIVYLLQRTRAFGPLSFLESGPRGGRVAVGHPQRALCDQLSQTLRGGGYEEDCPGTPKGLLFRQKQAKNVLEMSAAMDFGYLNSFKKTFQEKKNTVQQHTF